jgi:hypothetical protein
MKTIARSAKAELAILRAAQLAREIDDLLRVVVSDEAPSPGGSPYAVRVAQGLARSLVDQLGELEPVSRGFLASTRPVEEKKLHVA